MEDTSVEILLVEDNPRDEEMTLRALRKRGLANHVQVARDGAEALEYLFAADRRADGSAARLPSVVLLDLKLPKVDGLEVLRQIKQNEETRTIPVVVLTSSQEESDLVASYRYGVNSFIVKPVDFDTFADAVGQFGMYWLLVNKRPS